MPLPLPRRWFQVHLSTALVLMLAMGILMAPFVGTCSDLVEYVGWHHLKAGKAMLIVAALDIATILVLVAVLCERIIRHQERARTGS